MRFSNSSVFIILLSGFIITDLKFCLNNRHSYSIRLNSDVPTGKNNNSIWFSDRKFLKTIEHLALFLSKTTTELTIKTFANYPKNYKSLSLFVIYHAI